MFSLIVSIYNIDKYLTECIESILAQTYKEFELILVDDGSTDMSSQICDEYSAKDDRIKVIHKKNGGLLSTRKAGIQEAKNEYVCFLDGDDFIQSDMLQTYKEILLKYEVDIICAGLTEYYTNRTKQIKQNIPCGFYSKEILKNDIYKRMLSDKPFYTFCILPSVCAKCFRKSMVKPIYDNIFSEISLGEDAAVTYPALLRANSIYVAEYCGYMYRQNILSMTHTYDRNLYKKIKELLLHLINVEKNEHWYSKNQINEYCLYLLNFARMNEFVFNNTERYFQKKRNMNKYLKDELFKGLLKDIKIKSLKHRILLFCFKYRLLFLLYLYSRQRG